MTTEGAICPLKDSKPRSTSFRRLDRLTMENTDNMNETLITLTADIVSAHVRNNSVAVNDLPILIQNVTGALLILGTTTAAPEVQQEPAVPVRPSVKPAYVLCPENSQQHQPQ